MLVPGDPGRLVTPIYVFTVKPRNPWGKAHFMYAVAVET
jgi:hypothetical protein